MKEAICEKCGASYRGKQIPSCLKCVCESTKFKIIEN